MVQWFRLCASTAGGLCSIPNQGPKIPHATLCGTKKKKNHGHVAANIKCLLRARSSPGAWNYKAEIFEFIKLLGLLQEFISFWLFRMNWFSLRFPSKLVDISPNSRLGLLFEVEERLRERNFRAMLSGERTVEAFFFFANIWASEW